jgi:hypothetical protein
VSATATPGAGNANGGGGGLSGGAKAGIGIACAVAGLVVLGLLGYLFLQRKRGYGRQVGAYEPTPSEGTYTDYKAGGGVGALTGLRSSETPSPPYKSVHGGEEMESGDVIEMQAQKSPAEMGGERGGTGRAELA